MAAHCCKKRTCCLALGVFALIGAVSNSIRSILTLANWDWSLATNDDEKYVLKFLFRCHVASAILCLCLIVASSVYIYAVDQDRPRLMIPFLTWIILAVFVVLILVVVSFITRPMSPLAALLAIAATIKGLLCWLVYTHMKETMEATAGDGPMPMVEELA
ncbi:uncharacterized protein LOC108665416 [Hyalella azteca]|uniref:Uncharacterized protein LOC108665416 n=1 Tax=Hyalella azteca TaxID=294128 RepID=A0A8B7N1D6_HYAAZ|nr:uncharacterized protein LOC108665416 [Hyalella azteca]